MHGVLTATEITDSAPAVLEAQYHTGSRAASVLSELTDLSTHEDENEVEVEDKATASTAQSETFPRSNAATKHPLKRARESGSFVTVKPKKSKNERTEKSKGKASNGPAWPPMRVSDKEEFLGNVR
jgi:hypothetical protein